MRVQDSAKVRAGDSSPVSVPGSRVLTALAPGSSQSLVEPVSVESEVNSPVGRPLQGPVLVWKQEILRILSPLPSKVAEYNRMRRELDREIINASLVLRDTFPEMRETLLCPGCDEKFPNTQNLYRHLRVFRCKLQIVQQWASDLSGAVEVEQSERVDEVRVQEAAPHSTATSVLSPSSGQRRVEPVIITGPRESITRHGEFITGPEVVSREQEADVALDAGVAQGLRAGPGEQAAGDGPRAERQVKN